MKVKDIIQSIETIAPKDYQENYDNAGLIIGNSDSEVSSILLCLDSTEAVVDEAIKNGINLIIAHHPLIFKGIKKINGSNDVERAIIKAIQNNISIYAAHTNLDNVLHKGVNQKLASKIGLENISILQPKSGHLVKLVIYCPERSLDAIRDTLYTKGAGHIGLYSECSFAVKGSGTFKAEQGAKPTVGHVDLREHLVEWKIETVAPAHMASDIIQSVKKVHPYEEMAYDIIPLSNENQEIGSGMLGYLTDPMDSKQFLNHIKDTLSVSVIKYTTFNQKINKVAVCGGSGSFLLSAAKQAGADAFITSDVKYHEYFEVEKQLMFCDIGHYESEISTLEIFYEVIQEKYPNFAVIFCSTNTNPIQYHT